MDDLKTRARAIRSANCWTGTSRSLCDIVQELLDELERVEGERDEARKLAPAIGRSKGPRRTAGQRKAAGRRRRQRNLDNTGGDLQD